jgi:uncharacterized protein (TIGR01370 family)
MHLRMYVLLSLLAMAATIHGAEPLQPWVVYYSNQLPVRAFDPYRLVVLDSQHHPSVRALADRGKMVLGYISLGEVEQHRDWFAEVKAEGLLLMENKSWPGSYFVDVRDPRWTRRVIEELVPRILRHGFHGLFLDTLDNPPHLERSDPEKYRGMTAAAAALVRALRLHYPNIRLMMNRGYELLPEVGGHIDYELGESVFADYDFDAKTYRRVPEEEYRHQVELLQQARRAHPGLVVYTLDYWNPDDREGIAQIYRVQRANGFIPQVSVVELDRIIEEPPAK